MNSLVAHAVRKPDQFPTLDWSKGLYEDDIVTAIHEAADLTGARFEDHGIGAYEYGGISTVDHNFAWTVEDAQAVLRIVGAPAGLMLPEVTARHTYDGCDGEHDGRCRPGCASAYLEIEWAPRHHEIHDGVLYVVYYGSGG